MIITTAPHLREAFPTDIAIFLPDQFPSPLPPHVVHVEFLISPEPDKKPTLHQHVFPPMEITHRLLNEQPSVRSFLFILCDPFEVPSVPHPVEWKVICETLRGFCRNLTRELLGEINVSFHHLERFSQSTVLALGKNA